MSRIRPIGFVAALALAFAVAVTPASAFDHHFTVVSKQTSQHRVSKREFRFTEKLVATFDHGLRLGRDKVDCVAAKHKLRCKALVHLNGKLYGHGWMTVKGNIGRGDNTLNVISGSGGLDGVAGKVTTKSHNRLHFDLVR
jgi:hypothetical protein